MQRPTSTDQEVDVLIVGAGISGIGTACHLRMNCPEKSFLLLESRENLGGTWDLFRYPGIRSDSDMYTLGYSFKPWTDPCAIAEGDAILRYLHETADEYRVTPRIRFQHKVLSANWDSETSQWLLKVQTPDTHEPVTYRCNFLMSCGGYYDYEEGYTPEFAGQERFRGKVLHAQHWESDLDYSDKNVVVIGSGATAVTLVPELAKETASTVMLQRSPTYIATVPGDDGLAHRLRRFLPASWVYRLTRWKRVMFQIFIFQFSRRRPEKMKNFLLQRVREELGPEYDVQTHFTPSYNPWDQRLCAVPEGDLFGAIREGKAEVVTDHITRFTETGILLESGRELPADIIVLATGLNMKFAGSMALSVDGEEVDPSERYVYRGMMLSNVPNMATVFGYTNASWTLKADLTSMYVCRLLNHMSRVGAKEVIPRLENPAQVTEEPMLDFTSGYIMRARDQFPKQGLKRPWRVYQNYILDTINLRFSSLTGGVLEFR